MPIIIDPKTGLPFPVRTDKAQRSKRRGRVPGPEDVDQIDAQVLRDPGVHATPADFGAGIGKAIEQFGAAASRVASDFAEMRREAEDDTAAIAGLSEARVRFTRVAESMKTQATTAEGFAGNLGKALSGETDAILRDLRDVRGLRPSKEGEAAIRRRLGVLASRMVVRGAMSEHRIRLAKLGHEVDASVANAAMAAFNSPADFPAIIAETEAKLARFKDKLPPDILAAKAAAARETIAQNTVAGLIELDPALAIRGLKEGVFDDDLPAADRKRLRARAGAAQRDRRAQAKLDQLRERTAAGADGARRLVALEGAIGRGEAGEQAIAEAADILDDPTRARMRKKLDARRADDAARNRRIETVSAVLAGRAPATGAGDGDVKLHTGGGEDLRPGAPEWRQAVDDHYAGLADTLETMDPDGRIRFEDDYARTTGVLPGPVLKQVRGGLLSADPAAQAAAAQRLAGLNDGNPALFSAIPANERRRARDIAEFAGLGLPPPRAVELAEEKLAGEDDEPAGGAGNTTLIGDVRVGSEEGIPVTGPGGTPGKDAVSDADEQEQMAELPVENKALMEELIKEIEDHEKAQKEIQKAKDNPDTIVNLTMEESRIWAILNDKRNVWFNIKDNPKETGEAPDHRDREIGVKAVRDHDAVIEREARAQGVDPDLVRAIMYYENADGNVRGLGERFERVGMADTLFPMNINPKIWAGMGGVGEEEFKDPEKNIRAGVALIKGIWDRLRPEDRTAAKIGSIYNFTGRENVSRRGARIGRIFDERSWEK